MEPRQKEQLLIEASKEVLNAYVGAYEDHWRPGMPVDAAVMPPSMLIIGPNVRETEPQFEVSEAPRIFESAFASPVMRGIVVGMIRNMITDGVCIGAMALNETSRVRVTEEHLKDLPTSIHGHKLAESCVVLMLYYEGGTVMLSQKVEDGKRIGEITVTSKENTTELGGRMVMDPIAPRH